MKRLLIFVATGVLFGAAGEYMASVLVNHDPPGFLFTLPFNAIYLTLVYYSSRLLPRLLKKPLWEGLAYYLLYGLTGLMIEWFLIGNAPWDHTGAIQLGMFAYWATMSMTGRIFAEAPRWARLRRQMLLFFIPWALLSIVAGYLIADPDLRLSIFVLDITAGYGLMNLFFIRYIVGLGRPDPAVEAQLQ